MDLLQRDIVVLAQNQKKIMQAIEKQNTLLEDQHVLLKQVSKNVKSKGDSIDQYKVRPQFFVTILQ